MSHRDFVKGSLCPQTGKEPHPSKGAAEAHARSLREDRKGGYAGGAYFCEYCSSWHVGRPKQTAHKNKYRKGR